MRLSSVSSVIERICGEESILIAQLPAPAEYDNDEVVVMHSDKTASAPMSRVIVAPVILIDWSDGY